MGPRVSGNVWSVRTKGKSMRIRATEHDEQVTVIEWARLHRRKWPELELLFAIPNGGLRHVITARRLKAEGVQAGVPDLFLPVARDGKHGLFIEMKARDGKLSNAQKEWITGLRLQGYWPMVCYSASEAILYLTRYLDSPK